MGTDTAEMKLARLLPVSINVRGSIRFRQPGRRSDWPPARSAQRPVATMHASKALNEPLAIAFLLPAARLPEHQFLQPDLRTGKHFLGRCARPRNRKVPACRAPSVFRSVAQLQERAISLPRLILIPRAPTAPALARIDKIERNRSLSPPVSVRSSTYAKASSSSDGRLRCSPARLPKLGSCSRGSWGVVQEEAWLRS
jgi:hypothetical protein